ncbi:MAG: amidohydrolase family protein [Pseudomonadales bacterium]
MAVERNFNGGIIDTMVYFPSVDKDRFDWLQPALGTHAAGDPGTLPVDYLFKRPPLLPQGVDPIEFVVTQMDLHGVSQALVDATDVDGLGRAAVRMFPNRFFGWLSVDPNRGMDAVRALERAKCEIPVVAASCGPAFLHPQVPINDKKFYPIYAKCVELDVPIFLTVGVPGPRVPMAPQEVGLLDEVCWFFPELKLVMRHGAEPWVELAVKLMLKWPNLYYSTSAFAPKHYPRAIVDFANKRGADKVIFAGYFAVGLSYERIFAELPEVPFREHVWPKFLHENARRVFGLSETPTDECTGEAE